MNFIDYNEKYLSEILTLFEISIRNLCKGDYDLNQLNAWCSSKENVKFWNDKLTNSKTILAIADKKIVGFGNVVSKNNYIDCLYVHPNYTHRGIGSMLLNKLESYCFDNVCFVNASKTSLDFFVKHNYQIIKKQIVERNNVQIVNFKMSKQRNK